MRRAPRITEEYLLGRIAAGVTDLETIVSPEREARILQRGVDRTARMPAPHMVKPVGRFATLDAARDAFLAARTRTLAWLESYDADPRARLVTRPMVGSLNAYEMLLIMAVHTHRHAAQIGEIKLAI